MIIIINNVGRGGAASPAPPLLAGRWPAERLRALRPSVAFESSLGGGAAPPPVCLGLRPRAPLERFTPSVVIMDGGSGGAPAPPHPPRLLGLRPRAPLERFAFRALSEPSSACGTPKNEIPIYISHAGCQKLRVRAGSAYAFCLVF